jgi:arylsulfatase A-like enzyme
VQGIGRIGTMTGGKKALWQDDKIAETLTARAVKFIEQNKSQPFFLYFATHDIHVPRVPAARFRGQSQAGVRGDAIQEFDWSVGEVLQALDRLKLSDNTLVIVTSDNGGVLDHGDTVERDGDEKSNNGHAHNGALRGNKGMPYEGGTRVPFVARWPGRIKVGASDELICHVDSLATCATLLGRKLPSGTAPDSFNILPALLSEKRDKPVRDHLVEQGNRLAIRQGPWKYVSATNAKGQPLKRPEPVVIELYNLADDLGETKNLAAKFPDKANELAALLKQVCDSGHSRPE